MISILRAIRTRLLPAVVTSLGAVLVTAGLLSYADPATAGTTHPESPVIETLPPGEEPSFSFEIPSIPASGDPSASPGATDRPGTRAVATRVVIPALRIDLPVVRGNNSYPLCDVAQYLSIGQPGEGRATYIYAHARDGMFGPIYELAMVQHQGKKMLGMIVRVYTSDDRLYLYEIREVRLHQTSLNPPLSATSEELWLQTSEGPKGTVGKTQLLALPVAEGPADPADAHPKPKPVVCG